MLYNFLKFVHVAASIVWVGGMVAIAVLNARLAREGDAAVLGSVARQSAFFGQAVMGPAALTTLLAGIGMVALTGGRVPFWVAWGLVGVFGSMALGATVVRRASQEMAGLVRESTGDDPRLAAVRRRLAVAGVLNIALLLSTVAAMVFKPTL